MSILNNKKIIIAVSIIVVILVILVSIAAIIYKKGNSTYSDAYIHDKNAVKKIIENMNSQKERMAGFYSIDYARGSTLVLHNELYLMIVQRENGILQTSAVVDLKKIGCSYMQGSKYTTFKVSENAQYVCIQNKDSESSNTCPLYLLDTENETFDRYENGVIYLRLSRDDNLDGESYSIGNQKKLLTTVAKEKGYTNLLIYIDDGISGVTMNRPDYIRMIEDFENNKSSALFVKDLSRIGRNYIEVGRLTEEFLPEHDIRLVAVSDNIDTHEGENELAPIKNLFNEWYARDISKKRRISNKIKGNAGEPMGMPPYGYMKNPDGSKSWVVDEEAASVVRRIFDMTLEGIGTHQIADILASENVLIPTSYWISKGVGRPGNKTASSCEWKSSTIISILSKQEYCGDVINFKTYTKSYKNKKRLENDKENWVIFKGVHEPIIDRAVWEKIQEQRKRKTRKKLKADGEKNMFSGLLVCADCGSNLWYHFNQKNHDIQYFNCSGYNKGNRKICNSTHYIRVDFLEKVVLGEIRRLTKLATQYENEFAKIVMGHSIKAAEQERQLKQRELNSLIARDKELDNLFEHLYEDNVCGKITDDRFAKMSVKYESEQKEVSSRIKELQTEIESEKSKTVTSDMFMASVRKYTRARKLTPRMLNELIEKIEVHQSEKINGKTVQRLTIHYNCIGAIEIPNLDKLPENKVSVHTRQGVDVHYAACAS